MTFNDHIKGDKPVLVDFYADWCGPCRMMKPILEELKNKMGDKVTILKIDTDKNPQVSTKYQIRSIPTLMIFKNGSMVWRGAGVTQADQLENILLPHVA